jgi:hypothetical protein
VTLSTDTILVGIALIAYDAGFNRWATVLTAVGFAFVLAGYVMSLYGRISLDS